jgi:hypothetical protein
MYESDQQHPTTYSNEKDQVGRSTGGRSVESAEVFAAARSFFAEEAAPIGPPHTNRGVRVDGDRGLEEENPEKTEEYTDCVFDWYQASIPALPDQIEAAFIKKFGGEFSDAAPINGYDKGRGHSDLRFSIYWGQHHAHPNIKATSHHSQRIAEWVRECYPRHKVSRADVAFDFCFDGSFDYLTEKVAPIGKKAGVTSKFVGDPDENDPEYPDEMRTGRTWYFGSTKSDCMVTVYEKGLELRSKGIEGADINLCRLEVRIRPQKLRKMQAASLTPFEMVGFSKWISKAVGEILVEAPTVLPNYDKLEKPPLAALTHMADQYAGVIEAYLNGDDQGGKPRTWHDLNRFLHGAMVSKEVRRQAAGQEPRDLPPRPIRPRDDE